MGSLCLSESLMSLVEDMNGLASFVDDVNCTSTGNFLKCGPLGLMLGRLDEIVSSVSCLSHLMVSPSNQCLSVSYCLDDVGVLDVSGNPDNCV